MTLSPFSRPSIEDECCVDTGVCSPDRFTYEIPNLDLSIGAYDKPLVDGIIDTHKDDIEYSRFLELPMYNGGKNGGDDRIATAYIAHDCSNKVVCIAAHLDTAFLEANPSTQVEQDDDESWIRFGTDNGATKLKPSNANEFRYVGKLDEPFFIIGYEGCWSVDSIDGVQNIVNNYVEVHFSNGGDTTSTGKPASNGEYVCLTPVCNRPLISSIPTKVSWFL